MKRILLFLVMIFGFNSLFSQNYALSGYVKNTKDAPIAYANIILTLQDSTIIKGTSTLESGFFRIEGIKSNNYILSISYLGTNSRNMPIVIGNRDVELGPVILKDSSEELDEVVVIAQKPKLERKVDRLVFNVENTAITDGDIWEVIKKTPSVSVTDERISVKGNSKIGFLINNRLVPLAQDDIINLLSGNSASNVEAIEVITSPPAKYGAEYEILLNIKMKKNLIAGYNGAIYNRYKQGVFPKHTIGTNHYFKGKKTSTSVSYSFTKNKTIAKYIDDANFTDSSTNEKENWLANQEFISTAPSHNLSVFFDYDINEKNKISFSTLNTFNTGKDGLRDTETLISNPNGILESSFTSLNDSEIKGLNTSYFLDWTHHFDNDGELSFKSHFTHSINEQKQDVGTNNFDENGGFISEQNFSTFNQQKINLYSIQSDYAINIGKNSKLNTGVRYANISSENITEQDTDIDFGVDLVKSGLFVYDEQISAAYVDVNNNWDKWKVRIGLRGEQTDVDSKLQDTDKEFKRSYFELFPSFSFQYVPNKNNKLNLFHFRRITRPRYRQVNPFITFQTVNSTIEGDPNLLPAIQNYFGFAYTFKSNYTVELFYSDQRDYMSGQFFQDNDTKALRLITTNIGKRVRSGIDLMYSKNFTNFWYSYFLVSFYNVNNQFKNFETDELLKNNFWSYFIRFNNDFTLLKDKSLFIDLSARYSSPINIGNVRLEESSRIGLALRKKLFDSKLSVSMGIDDIFNKSVQFSSVKFDNQDLESVSRRENRLFTFGLRYIFGNTKIKSNKKSKRVEERSRL